MDAIFLIGALVLLIIGDNHYHSKHHERWDTEFRDKERKKRQAKIKKRKSIKG